MSKKKSEDRPAEGISLAEVPLADVAPLGDEVVPVRSADGMELKPVTLRVDAALGYGTRPAGTVIAYVGVPAGIDLNEALGALRNPHLIEV